jgi:ATP-binding cassette subfamily C exporter for protease/lipase
LAINVNLNIFINPIKYLMNSIKPRGLTRYFYRFRSQYLSLLGFSAVINILMLAPSWYMLQVYDRVLTSYDENTLLGLSLIVVFLYFIYGLLERYRGLVLVGISEALDADLAPELHAAVLRPSTKDRQNELGGLYDLNTVKNFVTGQPILSLLDAPWILIYIFAIALLHPSLGFIAFVSAGSLFALAVINQQLTDGKLGEAQKATSSERRLISNALGAADSIQVMGMRGGLASMLAQVRSDYLKNLLVASIRGVNLSSISKFFRTLIQSVAIGYGAYLAISGEITAGMIIAASILLGRVLAPIEGIINSWKQLSAFKKSYADLDELLRSNPIVERSVALGRPSGRLQLVDVSLRLREQGKPTLDKVNLIVEVGETLAVIGPSGAGKTSLLKVLCGVYKPQQGQALIDGSDLAFRDLDALGQHLGYLAQTTELLAGKASKNIARFFEEDSKAILKAAQLSGAHEMIIALPEGYETVLGDAGHGLSEGQKRKVGLARAVYRDPALVFLDEPGSGLDDASLLSVVQLIQALKEQKKTLVFTTHQPSLARLADKIAVVVEGQIRLMGPSADVLEKLSGKGGGA